MPTVLEPVPIPERYYSFEALLWNVVQRLLIATGDAGGKLAAALICISRAALFDQAVCPLVIGAT